MHVLEEFMDFMGIADLESATDTSEEFEPEETAAAISLQAFNGNDASVLLQLAATVQGVVVSILVDSGSSTSFMPS